MYKSVEFPLVEGQVKQTPVRHNLSLVYAVLR